MKTDEFNQCKVLAVNWPIHVLNLTYNAIVRAKLDYGDILYNAAKTVRNSNDSTQFIMPNLEQQVVIFTQVQQNTYYSR